MIEAVLMLGGIGAVFGYAMRRVIRQERYHFEQFPRCGESALGGPCTLRKGHAPIPDDSYQSGGHRYWTP